MHSFTFILNLVLLALSACGSGPRDPGAHPRQTSDSSLDDTEKWDGLPSQENVTLAAEDDVAHGLALDASYIVTFRTPGSGDRLNFASYAQKYQSHYLALAHAFASDPRVKDAQFISAVDLSAALPRDNDPFSGVDFATPMALRRAWKDSTPSESLIGSMFRLDFTDATGATSLLSEWDKNGVIWFAEPNYVSQTSGQNSISASSGDSDAPITDFASLADRYKKLADERSFWWSNAAALPDAYRTLHEKLGNRPDDMTTDVTEPVIAVLDSGVDFLHPALAGHIWDNRSIGAATCDHDEHGCNTTTAVRGKLGNGDVFPYDTTSAGESCTGKDPNCSHGTHVAGIIAGDSNWQSADQQRVAGVCPVCKIMIVKIVSKVGKQSGILDSSILSAFEYVSLFNHGEDSVVRVINASFGKFVRSRSVGLLVRIMKEKRGMILIGAAGNEDTLRMEFPAAFTDAVAVAAVDSDLRKVSFSNFGRWVDISAPGNAILSTVPGGLLDSKSGTSMATPFVAGVAGLMIAADPTISFSDLKTWLLQSADPTFYGEDANGGYNHDHYYPNVEQEKLRQPLLGSGVLNANKAIRHEAAEGLPIFSDLDRVTPGCSVIAVGMPGKKTPFSILSLGLLLIFPVLLTWRRMPRPLNFRGGT